MQQQMLHQHGLQAYRNAGILNMTLRVLLVAPQVFEIQHFLSTTKIDHILKIAANVTLSLSTFGNVAKDFGNKNATETESTLGTSTNPWVKCTMSPIVDAIYQRAADAHSGSFVL